MNFSPDLTQIINEFDDVWQRRDEDRIAAILTDPKLDRAALLELLMIDMEYRWKSLPGADAGPGGLPAKPRIDDYLQQFRQLHEPVPQEWIVEEFRVRHQWGDRPSIDEYLVRYGDRPTFRKALRDVISQIKRPVVRVHRQAAIHFQAELAQDLMIGRQQVGEPEPICLHHLLSGLKLIVCPLDELHVSRQQVALRTQSYNLITVENVSTNVPLQLSNGPLVPGASRDCQLPLQLAIADLVIDIRLTGA